MSWESSFARESWMFDESVAEEEMKRLMLVPDSQEQMIELVDFDRGLAMETIDGGLLVVPFWSECASLRQPLRGTRTLGDRIHQRLRDNLRRFER